MFRESYTKIYRLKSKDKSPEEIIRYVYSELFLCGAVRYADHTDEGWMFFFVNGAGDLRFTYTVNGDYVEFTIVFSAIGTNHELRMKKNKKSVPIHTETLL